LICPRGTKRILLPVSSEEIVVLGGPKEYYCPSQVRKLIWLRESKRTLLPGLNKEIDLSKGAHKNIITSLEGVNKEIDLSPGVQKNTITWLIIGHHEGLDGILMAFYALVEPVMRRL